MLSAHDESKHETLLAVSITVHQSCGSSLSALSLNYSLLLVYYSLQFRLCVQYIMGTGWTVPDFFLLWFSSLKHCHSQWKFGSKCHWTKKACQLLGRKQSPCHLTFTGSSFGFNTEHSVSLVTFLLQVAVQLHCSTYMFVLWADFSSAFNTVQWEKQKWWKPFYD